MAIATVLSITGRVWARDEEGNVRELSVGDTLLEGEVLVTSDNGSAQLDFGDGLDPTLVEGGEQIAMTPELETDGPLDGSEFAALDDDLEALLTAIDEGEGDLLDILEAPAAGPGAGGGGAEGGGHNFVRLARIAEEVNPLAFEYGLGMAAELPEIEGFSIEVIAPTAGSFSAMLSDAELGESGAVTGVLPFSFGNGANGSVTFAGMDGMQVQIGQESITYSWDDASGTLTASSDRGVDIFTIEVNTSTGEFTLTQLNNLLHEENTDEALASLQYTVTSTSGTATGTLNVTIVDDVPTLDDDADAIELTFQVDEAELGEASRQDVREAINEAGLIDYGADGKGSLEISLQLNEEGAESGLYALSADSTGQGDAILLRTNADGEVEGYTEAGGVYFTLTLDGDELVFTQQQAIWHADEEETFSLAEGVLELSFIGTDGDGDTVSGNVDLGSSATFTIVDDVPVITPETDALDDLQVDESAFGEPATADFSGAFTIDFGADGEGSISYSLSIDGNGETGLVTTEGGHVITLKEDNGTVIGEAADGRVAFTIAVNAATGEVTLTQQLALSHPDGTNPADILGLASSGLMLNATAIDGDGDTVTAGIELGSQLSFVDDGPQANNDYDLGLLIPGRFEKSGNVMKNDVEGADGAEVTHITFGGETVELVDGKATIEGAHGTLSIKADGSYTYVRGDTPNHQGLFLDNFTYTLTDGDGDTDTATLTVKGFDAGVGIVNIPPFGQGAHLVVNEANLSDGTSPDLGALTQGGNFLVSAVDGLDTLTITIGEGDDQQSLTVNRSEGGFDLSEASIDVEGYKLEVTGISPGPFGIGYVVSYEYTLKDNKDHSGQGDDKALTRDFTITVTDRDGDTANSNLTVKVIDDAPEADLGGARVATEGGEAITGSWSTKAGADSEDTQQLISINDGAEQALQIGHAYELDEGTLTFHENGTWTFVPGINLDHNEKQSISFELIKIDGDGDRASDTHRIKIRDGSDPTPGGENGEGGAVELVVDELGLREGGDVELANAEAALTFTAGSDNIVDFAFINPGAISVNGLAEGVELTWEINEADELIGKLDNEPVLKLTLSGGEIAAGESGTVTVNVELVGNLPHNVDVDELTISGVQVVATDSDGDVSAPGSVSVQVDDDLPSVEGTNPTGHEVIIENLGSAPGVGYNNSFGYYIKDADGNPTVGMVIWSNVKNDVSDTYTLEGYAPGEVGYFIIPNGANKNSGLENKTEVTFEKVDGVWVAITSDGTQLAGENSDAPVLFNDSSLHPDGASHVENNAEEGHLNWEDIYGAGSDHDYNDVNINVEWTPANLTVDESQLNVDDTFDFSGYFTAEYGADGLAESGYSLSVTENGADSGLVDTASGKEILVKVGDDGQIIGYIDNGDNIVATDIVFTLTVDANGVVTLNQLRAIAHSGAGQTGTSDAANILADTVFLTKTVTDSDGDEASATIDIGQVIYFLDDGPQAKDDNVTQDEENAPVLIDVFDNDKGGADGVDLDTGVALVDGSLTGNGTLVYNGDGTFTYTPADGEEGVVTFKYTITDRDGDTSTATVTITLQDDSIPTVIPEPDPEDNPDAGSVPQGAHGVVSESALQGGSGGGSASYTGSLNISHSGNDTTGGVKVGGIDVTNGGTVTGTYGTLVVTEENGEYSWTYTLTGPATHPDGEATGTDDQVRDTFEVLVTDSDGTVSDPATLTVAINDDGPVTSDIDAGSVTEDDVVTTVSGNVKTHEDNSFGADGEHSTDAVTWGAVTANLGGAAINLDDYGDLAQNEDGSWSFVLDNSKTATQALKEGENIEVSFEYTLTDKDGDSSTNSVSFQVKGVTDITTAELTSRGSGDEDNGSVTYTVTLDEATPADQDFTVTLNNGQTVTITVLAESNTGSITLGWGDGLIDGATQLAGYPDEDVYKEPDFDLEVVEGGFVAGDDAANNFDQLVLEDNSSPITISDTIDTTTVSITATVIKTSEITVENVGDDPGFTVKAYRANGDESTISINGDPVGFGVAGSVSGGSGKGDDKEIGFDTRLNKSEKLEVEFNHQVKTFEVQFAWRNPDEKARVDFYDGDTHVGYAVIRGGDGSSNSARIDYFNSDGTSAGTPVYVQGGSDEVDNPFAFHPPGAPDFNKAVFSAVGADDDYLVHSVKYAEVLEGDEAVIYGPAEVIFDVWTDHAPDPDWEDPTVTVHIVVDGVVVQEITVPLRTIEDEEGVARGVAQVGPIEVDGDEVTAEVVAVNGNFEDVDVPVSLTLPKGEAQPPSLDLGDDAIVVNEKFLKGGSAEGEGDSKLTQNGEIGLIAEGGIKILTIGGKTLSFADLQALEDQPLIIELASGNTLTLTGFDGDSTGGTLSYEFTLNSAIDHEVGGGRNDEVKGFDVTLEDSQGKTATSELKVKVIDDVPESSDNVQAIQVPVSELEVGELNAGWKNVQGTSGSGNIKTSSDANGISMQWGGNGGSGYGFVYADGLADSTEVAVDSLFTLGTFTHNNFVIDAGQKTLDTAELEVTFSVMIDGVLTEVTTTIMLDHDETPNNYSGPNEWKNDDIIKITNPDQEQVIQVGDREYVLKIRGFLDEESNKLVDKVRTPEGAATSFKLYAEISSTGDLPTVEGKVDADWGADGAAENDSLLWSDGGVGTLVEGTIEGQFGTLTVNANGSYTYEVSRSARDGMKADESYQDTFTYYLIDADGDRVESTLTIDLEGVPNGIVASDNVAVANLSLDYAVPENAEPSTQIDGTTVKASNSKGASWSDESKFEISQDKVGLLTFTADIDRNSGEATLYWELLKEDANGIWNKVSGVGGSAVNGNNSSGYLEEGIYKVVLSAETNGGSNKWFQSYPEIRVGDVNLVSYAPAINSEEVKGNVLTDLGIDGSADIPGSSDTQLKVLVDEGYKDATEGGLTVSGQYGTFVLYADGRYEYTPDADVANVGEIDSLTYQLVHPSGTTAEASLQVGITGPGVDSFVWGTDGDNTVNGSDGNDVIIGGVGDDILFGGDGADTFKWNLGDQGEAGDAAIDTVTDFTQGEFGEDENADRLDLADLLQEENEDNIGDYIFAEQDGEDTVLHISSTGHLGENGEGADQQIILKNVEMGPDSSTFITNLLESGQLKIDTE